MKKLLAIITIGILLFGVSGCSCLAKLPSVTVGGKANHDPQVGVDLDRSGLDVSVPLVDVNVPFPSLGVGGKD